MIVPMLLKGDDFAEVLKRWKNMFCSVLHIKQLSFYVLVAFNNETFFILKGVYMLFMNVV